MTEIPPEVILAVTKAVAACNVGWKTAIDDPATVARTALEAAEKAWPHDPPQRDLASTTAAVTERAPARAGWARYGREPFGFGKAPT